MKFHPLQGSYWQVKLLGEEGSIFSTITAPDKLTICNTSRIFGQYKLVAGAGVGAKDDKNTQFLLDHFLK